MNLVLLIATVIGGLAGLKTFMKKEVMVIQVVDKHYYWFAVKGATNMGPGWNPIYSSVTGGPFTNQPPAVCPTAWLDMQPKRGYTLLIVQAIGNGSMEIDTSKTTFFESRDSLT